MKTNSKKGQALVSLIAFIAFGVVVTGAAVTMAIVNSRTTDIYSTGDQVLSTAETGADNAILKLLRNPNYTVPPPGETLSIGTQTATITVTGGATKTITSEGFANGIKRKIEVIGTFTNNVFTLTSWKEID